MMECRIVGVYKHRALLLSNVLSLALVCKRPMPGSLKDRGGSREDAHEVLPAVSASAQLIKSLPSLPSYCHWSLQGPMLLTDPS